MGSMSGLMSIKNHVKVISSEGIRTITDKFASIIYLINLKLIFNIFSIVQDRLLKSFTNKSAKEPANSKENLKTNAKAQRKGSLFEVG